LIGDMHTSAMTATKQGFRVQRADWKMSRLLTNDMETTLAPLTAPFRQGVGSLVSDIGRLPTTATNYGLIHSDVNAGNCHIDGEQLRIFDFDNCEYGYFLQDLATFLYDTLYSKTVKHVPAAELTSAVGTLWNATLEGYFQSGPALDFSADELCRFFLLREAILYTHYHRILPSESWSDPFLAEMRRHVETRSHPLDFEQMAK
jgi:Ser/Thr protein kinase RdoA (MazF antagonist)